MCIRDRYITISTRFIGGLIIGENGKTEAVRSEFFQAFISSRPTLSPFAEVPSADASARSCTKAGSIVWQPTKAVSYTHLVGISYEEASQIVERSPLAEPVADALGVAIFSHDLPYYWAMFFYYGNGYWQKGIPAQPEDMDAYEALENKIMEKYDLKEPFIWT